MNRLLHSSEDPLRKLEAEGLLMTQLIAGALPVPAPAGQTWVIDSGGGFPYPACRRWEELFTGQADQERFRAAATGAASGATLVVIRIFGPERIFVGLKACRPLFVPRRPDVLLELVEVAVEAGHFTADAAASAVWCVLAERALGMPDPAYLVTIRQESLDHLPAPVAGLGGAVCSTSWDKDQQPVLCARHLQGDAWQRGLYLCMSAPTLIVPASRTCAVTQGTDGEGAPDAH